MTKNEFFFEVSVKQHTGICSHTAQNISVLVLRCYFRLWNITGWKRCYRDVINNKQDKKIITENLSRIIRVKIHCIRRVIRSLGPLRLTFNWYVTLFHGVKWPVCEASKSPSSNADVTNFLLQLPCK